MSWTLNKKLIIIMVALSATMIAMMQVINIYSERALLRAIQRKTEEISESVHLAIEEMTREDRADMMRLYRYLKRLESEGVEEINIIDSATRITASTNPFKIGETTPEEVTELIFKSELGELVTKRGDRYNVIIPVVARGEHQGYIQLVISTEDVSGVLRAHAMRRVAATVLIFIGGIAAAVWLARRYTRPIKEVVSAARAVAAGDLDIELEVTERDEIGELKKSFNQMTARLSELRILERRLREAEHLSTVGELSRSVAHEIRNPLNFISLSVDHIIDGSVDADVKELLLNIKQEIKRLDRLVGDFLAYGRPLKLRPQTVNIIDLIEETLSLVQARAERAGVRITRNYRTGGSLMLTVDPELMKTCLLNVFQNAFQAMPEGGELTIEVYRDGGRPCISVKDTGTGVEEGLKGRVFEPFFSTRQQGLPPSL